MIERNVYEVNLSLGNGDQYFTVEHRFPSLPEVETLVALKGEAEEMFRALFDRDCDEIGVHVIYLNADERGDPELEGAPAT